MDRRNTNNFSYWLQGELKRRGMTQQDFADQVGRSRPTISKWLSGRETPSSDVVEEIARILRVDPQKVFNLLLTPPPLINRYAVPERDIQDLLIEVQDRIPPEVEVSEDPYFDATAVMGRLVLPYLPLDITPRSHYEAFVTDEQYMVPAVIPGDIVVMDMSAHLEPGDLVAGDLGGHYPERRQVMRLVERSDGRLELQSDGDEYTVPFRDDVILSKVVMVIRDFSLKSERNQQSLLPDYHAWFRETTIRQRQRRDERERNERRRKSANPWQT